MAKIYNFKTQLELGQKAEADFLKIYHEKLTPSEDRAYDFLLPDGRKLELKTDFYGEQRSKNFFMERWSVFEKKKPGGAWQSRDKGTDVLVYFYPDTGNYYVFDNLAELIHELDHYVHSEGLSLCMVRNKGYNGGGYKIPREVLKDVYRKFSGGDTALCGEKSGGRTTGRTTGRNAR